MLDGVQKFLRRVHGLLFAEHVGRRTLTRLSGIFLPVLSRQPQAESNLLQMQHYCPLADTS